MSEIDPISIFQKRLKFKIMTSPLSEDNSVADCHSFYITFQIFPTMVDDGEYLGEFPIHFVFLIRAQKWATTTKFGERPANWPLVALLFIDFFLFHSQIHRIFVRFCFHRFPTLSSVPRKR